MVDMPDPAKPTDPPPARELGEHLATVFPGIAPSYGRGGDPCWAAWALAQNAEHNPPAYWLGRAFDVLAASPYADHFARRLQAAHADRSCHGGGDEDGHLQDVLTEICAFAWSTERIGATEVIVADEVGIALLHVPASSTTIVPRRLLPERTMERVVAQIGEHAASAARAVGETSPPGRGILYLDIWHERRYAHSVGYRLEITEPVQLAVRHYAPESELGYVLTRPYQWGRPLEEWF